MSSHERRFTLVVALIFAGLAVGACSAGSSGPSPVPTNAATTSAATAVPATAVPGSSSAATTAATRKPAAGNAQVNLVFSGTRAITAKGTAGRCIIIKRADGTFSFGFEATETDYPGLGKSYSMANLNGDYVDIKWVIEDKIAYGNPVGGGGTLSADHHSVTIDVDLSPFTTQGAPTPGPEHVKGTITCP